jgi:phospholipid/cholesterol/gamma-HCH transport system substrate-binding protein
VQIASVSPLGDNFLGIRAGTIEAPHAPRDATLKTYSEYTSFSDIADMIAKLEPNAEMLLANLNDRVVALKDTMDRVNDLLSPRNRANIAASLADLHGMLAENRATIHSTLNNVNASSAKLGSLIDDLHKTATQANTTLAHLDDTIGEERPELRKAIADLRQTLNSTVTLTAQLNNMLSTNSENLDEIIDNLRHVTENLNAFTETISTRPYTLIRGSGVPAHEPGQAPPK